MSKPPAFVGLSSGVRIAGNVDNIDGDVIGGDKTTINNIGTYIQGIDTEIKTRISETNENVTQVLKIVKRGATNLRLIDNHPILVAARSEADRLCNEEKFEDASRTFTEILDSEEHAERQRREDYRRLRVRLLEEAIVIDKRALNAEAVFRKILLIGETMYPDNLKAKIQYLISKGSEYQDQGKLKDDRAALFIALSVFSWIAKSTLDVERA